MPNATVRISDAARNILRELAARSGEPMQAVLDKAVESYRRKRFLEEVNAAYADLRRDRKVWAAIMRERTEWEATLGDGLEPGEMWTEDGKAKRKIKRRPRCTGPTPGRISRV